MKGFELLVEDSLRLLVNANEWIRIVGIRRLAIAKVVIATEWIWPYAGSCEFLVDHWMKGGRS